MNLGLKDTHWVAEIKDAYAAARRSNAYNLDSYCMADADGTSARTESLYARIHSMCSHHMDCLDARPVRRILGRDDTGVVRSHASTRRHIGHHEPAGGDGARSAARSDHDWRVRRLPMQVGLASERCLRGEGCGLAHRGTRRISSSLLRHVMSAAPRRITCEI